MKEARVVKIQWVSIYVLIEEIRQGKEDKTWAHMTSPHNLYVLAE
jgi:hypothetical protein